MLLTEPLKWGMRVAVIDLELVKDRGQWTVTSAHSHLLDAKTVDADPAVVSAVQAGARGDREVRQPGDRHVHRAAHDGDRMLGGLGRDRLDQLRPGQHHQSRLAERPRRRAAGPLHCGRVLRARWRSRPDALTIRDVAGLYIFDNTLLAIKVTGAQVKAYLEWSAQYFRPVGGTTARAQDVTNAVTADWPRTAPRTTTTTSCADWTRR